MRDLGTFGGPSSMAYGINNLGQVAGYADGPNGTHAFLYRDGVMQDRNACLRERGAAADMARRGAFPAPDTATLQQNALARCARQPASDREACEARVMGSASTSVTGSVLGGGVIRQTETPIR
jgi:probable HAF family extracellular repeat protein